MKKKLIAISAIILLLIISFLWGVERPSHNEAENQAFMTESEMIEETLNYVEETKEDEPKQESAQEKTSEEKREEVEEINEKDATEEVELVAEQEVEEAEIKEEELLCTISVTCRTILDNMDYLTKGKEGLVPSDGVILREKTVTFYDGESVFNVLQRELKREKIHLEFVKTPVFNSCYIEGINNIYEFDCGEGSGWMYSVNGAFPSCGSSRYTLRNGDKIEYIYSCDLGRDIGGENAAYDQRQ